MTFCNILSVFLGKPNSMDRGGNFISTTTQPRRKVTDLAFSVLFKVMKDFCFYYSKNFRGKNCTICILSVLKKVDRVEKWTDMHQKQYFLQIFLLSSIFTTAVAGSLQLPGPFLNNCKSTFGVI